MTFNPPSPQLVVLSEAIAAYCSRSETGVDDALPADLILLRTAINRLELDFSRHAARFAASYDEELYYNPAPVPWMRENCRMTSSAAGTAVCVGEQVERLEKSAAALREGRPPRCPLGAGRQDGPRQPRQALIQPHRGSPSEISLGGCEEITTIDRDFLARGPLGPPLDRHRMDEMVRAIRRAIAEVVPEP